jgi:hypothetical protein
VKSPAAIGVIRHGGERVFSVALSPDQRTLAAGDEFGNLVFYDARTRSRRGIVRPRFGSSTSPDDNGIYALAYRPDGRRLAVASGTELDVAVTVFDTRTRRPVKVMAIPSGRAVDRLQYSADGRVLHVVAVDVFGGSRGSPSRTRPVPRSVPRSEFIRFDASSGRRLGDPAPVGGGYLTTGGTYTHAPVALTGDGRRLVRAARAQTLMLDAASLRVVRPPSGRLRPGVAGGAEPGRKHPRDRR